jgi:hypothetical protein
MFQGFGSVNVQTMSISLWNLACFVWKLLAKRRLSSERGSPKVVGDQYWPTSRLSFLLLTEP